VFETSYSAKTSTPASAVWARWVNPARWHEWDERVQGAEAEGELAEGSEIRVKLRKGGTLRQRVTAFEPGRRLVTEYRLPGSRVGHEHLVEQRGPGSEVSHRLYVDGPLSGLWSLMLGRRKLREAVEAFTDSKPP
jgi:hypothetical protein